LRGGMKPGVVAAGLLVAVLLSGCGVARSTRAAAESASSGTYVALGDSYTAAPLLAGQDNFSAGCFRSTDDYPALVARALDPRSFVNVSCYGASTYDMTHTEQTLDRANPPQLSALSAADSLVTVQVGGDDIGFSRILGTCAVLSLTDPFGSPCEDHYAGQLAQEIASTEPKITTLLDSVRDRAPHARILLIGYPDILPVSGEGCWPWVLVARGDVSYLRDTEIRLNAMLAAAAARAGVGYVGTYQGTIGHDACQPSSVKWVEGLLPTELAAPMHPDAAGEQAMARLVVAAIR
jgi:lysophospholipase L1-like esterase